MSSSPLAGEDTQAGRVYEPLAEVGEGYCNSLELET